MSLAFLIPLTLGLVGILQGVLNKQIAGAIGVAHGTMLGSVVTLVLSIILYLAVKFYPQAFPEFFHVKTSLTELKLWYLIPGIFGVMIVAGLPFAFYKLGAVKVTVGLIAAQMVTSVIWDSVIENLPMNWTKALGMVLAFLSVLLIMVVKA